MNIELDHSDYSEISAASTAVPVNLMRKAAHWRDEAIHQPDRAEELIAWAEQFEAMAEQMGHAAPRSSPQIAAERNDPRRGHSHLTRTVRAVAAAERFANPGWMNRPALAAAGEAVHKVQKRALAPGL